MTKKEIENKIKEAELEKLRVINKIKELKQDLELENQKELEPWRRLCIADRLLGFRVGFVSQSPNWTGLDVYLKEDKWIDRDIANAMLLAQEKLELWQPVIEIVYNYSDYPSTNNFAKLLNQLKIKYDEDFSKLPWE